MLGVWMFVFVVGVAMSAPLTFDADEHWELFKQTHSKQYVGDVEVARKMIFSENLKYIHNHNINADMGEHSYWLGVNQYADWSNEEFKSFMNGYKKPENRNGSVFLPPQNAAVPDTVDWRQKGYVTPVKNQQQCGSCWSFSATGSLEGQHYRKTGQLVSLSEQNLVDCSTPEGDHGCGGGVMDFAFQYVKENHGIDTEECYPYQAQQLQCRYKSGCVGATVTGYVDVVPQGKEDMLKKAVGTVGPVSVAIDASHRTFQLYRNGVYYEPECSPTQLDHGVLVAGYGSDDGHDYWLVKNSWGNTWGLGGYIKMARNKKNNCGISTMASYPLV